jgi:hypothetical protein
LVARLLWEQDAAGSNPVIPIQSNILNNFDSRPIKESRVFCFSNTKIQILQNLKMLQTGIYSQFFSKFKVIYMT